jgi:hypothetical protein
MNKSLIYRRSTMFLHHYRFRLLAPVLVAFASIPLAAQQSAPPQTGVYHCTNGFLLTISRCGKVQGVDACFFKIENKGQVLMDSPGSLDGVNKIVKKCKGEDVEVQAAPGSPGKAAPTNPPYLSEMPALARILAEIKGKDAEDTGERQMGAYRALVQIIDDMAWGLGHRNVSDADSRAATPDERRLRFAYETAYADLWHKVTNKEGHVYDHDLVLHHELLQKFFTENFRAQYFQSNKNDAAEYEAFQKRMNPTPPTGAAQNGPAGQHYATDAGSVAVRKCVESGRSDIECLTEGFKVGIGDLAGKDSFMATTLRGNKDPGLRLTGTYSAAGVSMTFEQDYAVFSCNGLMPDPRPYSVQLNGSQVKVTVMAGPVTFSYQDGKLVGPGATNVPGRVQAGPPVATHGIAYQTHTEKEWVNPTAFNSFAAGEVHSDGMGFYVNRKTMGTDAVQTTRYEIPTEPKTVRCNLGVIPATGETPRIADTVTTFLGSNTSKSENTKPGLRLNGTYAAQGGLNIDFRDDSATLECRDADNSEAYAVVPEGGHLVVKFDNKTGPLSLVLQPNGSLLGQGAIDVAGRRIIQGTGNDPNHFVPVNQRCTVGTLVAQKAQ